MFVEQRIYSLVPGGTAEYITLYEACGSAPGMRWSSTQDTTCVEDVDNQFSDWIQAHPGSVLVLRPDRYIAAQCTAAELSEVTRQFAAFTCEPRREQPLAA